MTVIHQSLLYGRLITPDKHISESTLYKRMAGKTELGKVPVYGNNAFQYNSGVSSVYSEHQGVLAILVQAKKGLKLTITGLKMTLKSTVSIQKQSGLVTRHNFN